MYGNVWEWVQDCYADTYAGAPTDGSAAQERPDCDRVVRGGSWESGPDFLRSAFRGRVRRIAVGGIIAAGRSVAVLSMEERAADHGRQDRHLSGI